MAPFKTIDGRFQAADGVFEQLGVLGLARGFVSRHFRKGSDALRLFKVRLGQFADFRFELAQQGEQFRPMALVESRGTLEATLYFCQSLIFLSVQPKIVVLLFYLLHFDQKIVKLE